MSEEKLWWAYAYNIHREITCVHLIKENRASDGYIPLCGKNKASLSGQIEPIKDLDAVLELYKVKNVCGGCKRAMEKRFK